MSRRLDTKKRKLAPKTMDTDPSSTTGKRRTLIRFERKKKPRTAFIDEDDYRVVNKLYRNMGRSKEYVEREVFYKGKLSTREADGRVFRLEVFNDDNRPAAVPPCIGQLETLTELEISGIKSLPTSIGLLRNLGKLCIAYAREMTYLPKEIGDLTNLNVLEATCTGIKSLPPSIGKLRNLEKLCITTYAKEMTYLPKEIGDLTNLNVLEVTCAGIKSLPPSIGRLQNLTNLKISRTPIACLPPSVGKLKNLKEFSLYAVPINCLPPSIGKLQNLKMLNLDRTGIASLPPSIGKLQNLKKLNLSWTEKLSSLPTEIGDLAGLTDLRLEHTGIASLPPSIGNLQSLTSLDLPNSRHLSSLPKEIGKLQNLKKLDLSSTHKLLSLPEEIGELACLNDLVLLDSLVASLPPSIGNLQSLISLDLAGTNTLSSLPKEIGNLTNLRVLKSVGSGIYLVSLPNSMRCLTSLMQLEVCSYSRRVNALQENEHMVLRMLLQHCQILGELFLFGGIHFSFPFSLPSTNEEECLYAMACNRARFRTGFRTIANQLIADKDSIQTTRKLWPIMLKNATSAFLGYSCRDDSSISTRLRCRKPLEMPKEDAVYHLLAMGMESFIGVLLDRKTKKS